MSKLNSNNSKDSVVTIKHKGETYSEEDLDVIFQIVAENYVPTKKYIDDVDYNPSENLSEKELKDLNEWKIKIRASSWKSRQRSLRKQGKLHQDKIDTLNKLGMVWNPQNDIWEKQYLLYRKIGLCDEIENWVYEQRELYKSDTISRQDLYRLNAVNFPFEASVGEHFPFTYNSIYALQEKLRKKIRRIELKVINNPPKILTEKQKEIIKKEKQSKKRKQDQKPINSFYTKIYMINGGVESNLLKLSFQEITNLISQIESGKSIYDDAKKDYLDKVVKNRDLGYFTKSYVKDFYKELNVELDDKQKFYQISHFNTTKFDLKVRLYVCNILLNYYELIADNKLKNFKPLDFLITYYKKQKNITELLNLEKFINKYPLLFQLYNDKIDTILQKLKYY